MNPVSLNVTKFSQKVREIFKKIPSFSVLSFCDYHCIQACPPSVQSLIYAILDICTQMACDGDPVRAILDICTQMACDGDPVRVSSALTNLGFICCVARCIAGSSQAQFIGAVLSDSTYYGFTPDTGEVCFLLASVPITNTRTTHHPGTVHLQLTAADSII